MTPEDMRQKAMELFWKRAHCSQAVLAAGQERMNILNEDVLKALGSFGGGIAGTGRACGALTGAVALISSLFSRGNLNEKEDPRMWSLSLKFIERFEQLTSAHGGVDCRAIARVDWQNREAVKEFYSNPESRRKVCAQLVGDAAYVLGELLDEEKL